MPSLDQETYDLYSDQLKSLKLGHALYEPEPNEDEDEVQIGDVGYIKYGRFMRFASVFTSEHGIPAVDEKYRLITKLGKLDKGVMSSRSVHSEKVEFELSASEPISGASLGACLKFSCESDRGASLITRHRSNNTKSKFPNVLEEHFIRHLNSFKYIAEAERFPIKNVHDIILVTGRVMTGDWATIVFRSRTEESNASFDINAATITASGKIWGKWSEHVSYPRRHGPARQHSFSDDQEPPEETWDQCIFIDTCRIVDLAWYKRIKVAMMQKSGPTAFPTHTPESSSNASRASPTEASQGSSSSQVTVGSGSGSYKSDEILSPYEVLAFHAFNTLAPEFDFIRIQDEDLHYFQPESCSLENLRDASMNLNVVRLTASPNPNVIVGMLQHNIVSFDSERRTIDDTSTQLQRRVSQLTGPTDLERRQSALSTFPYDEDFIREELLSRVFECACDSQPCIHQFHAPSSSSQANRSMANMDMNFARQQYLTPPDDPLGPTEIQAGGHYAPPSSSQANGTMLNMPVGMNVDSYIKNLEPSRLNFSPPQQQYPTPPMLNRSQPQSLPPPLQVSVRQPTNSFRHHAAAFKGSVTGKGPFAIAPPAYSEQTATAMTDGHTPSSAPSGSPNSRVPSPKAPPGTLTASLHSGFTFASAATPRPLRHQILPRQQQLLRRSVYTPQTQQPALNQGRYEPDAGYDDGDDEGDMSGDLEHGFDFLLQGGAQRSAGVGEQQGQEGDQKARPRDLI